MIVDSDENGVSVKLKYAFGIITAVIAFIIISDVYANTIWSGMGAGEFFQALGGELPPWIMIIISWIWLAPYLAKEAGRYNRNPNWGFTIGLVFGIPGVLVSWIYYGIVGVKE